MRKYHKTMHLLRSELIVFVVCACAVVITLNLKSRVYQTGQIHDLQALDSKHSRNEMEKIVVYFHERRPYYLHYIDGVHGLVADPINLAFQYADIPFVWRETPAKRQLNIIQQNEEKSCAAGWFKTAAREKFAQYSSAIYQDKPFVAVTRANNTQLEDNMVLGDIFGKGHQLLLVKSGYSYGNYIDKLIETHSPRMASTTAENRSMLQMIQKHRADYCLMTEEEAADLLLFSGIRKADFKLVHFNDTPTGNRRYLICTKMVSMETMDSLNGAIQQAVEFSEMR